MSISRIISTISEDNKVTSGQKVDQDNDQDDKDLHFLETGNYGLTRLSKMITRLLYQCWQTIS